MRRTFSITVLGLILLIGCRSGPTVYVHSNADFSLIKKVAVLPFENLTQDRFASDKVQKILVTELLSLGAFEVAEPGQVFRVLANQRIENVSNIAAPEIKKVGEALGVQALFRYRRRFWVNPGRNQSIPRSHRSVTTVETQSGITLWSVSHTRSGVKIPVRLFGIGGETPTEAAGKLIRREVNTILK